MLVGGELSREQDFTRHMIVDVECIASYIVQPSLASARREACAVYIQECTAVQHC